jgi:hypothetical protein
MPSMVAEAARAGISTEWALHFQHWYGGLQSPERLPSRSHVVALAAGSSAPPGRRSNRIISAASTYKMPGAMLLSPSIDI